jgi:diguanylate cyclase (GGDEF)-like protein/putative nucleotidyltransferase with HDIG domain
MNVYALFPFIATIAYIPLLLTTVTSRPWHGRHKRFILFLISAMLWSITDIFLRSNYFPQYSYLLLQLIIITFVLTVVQFHVFVTSFYSPGQRGWFPLAYGTLAGTIILVILRVFPNGVIANGDKLYLDYGRIVFFIGVPILILTVRGVHILRKRLKTLDNPVLYNQIISILLGIGALAVFTFASFLPVGREYPIAHFGNIANAFILSYAVIRHRLVDIRIVLRQSTAWLSLAVIGTLTFWLLLMVLHSIFNFELDLLASSIATVVAFFVAIFIYKVRGHLFELMSRAFQGSTYDYHQRLNEFTNRIHNVFSLKEQGGELLTLIIKALNIKQACLLFPEAGSEEFKAQFVEPKDEGSHLGNLRLRAGNPIIKYLEREQKSLHRENLSILPAFLGLWPQEREEIESKKIAMFMPLISRDRLIAILVLGEKKSGKYSLEDLSIIENVTGRVAVSMEKEYLREQLREREEELSVINNSSVILSSSLDIQESFGNFIEELKKVVDVSWASIVLLEDNGLCCMALSSPEISAYQVGDRLPMEGTGTGWVVTQKKPFIEPDLTQERVFSTGDHFYESGLRTIVYLPLVAKGRVIGSFIAASKNPNAYSQRHMKLLEQLASQIAMPLENSQLYARAEKKARVDELTGLLNRRSLDEMIDSEISRHSRYGGAFSLAILDLDSFKTFNDTYGHLAGDKLLRDVGSNIKGAIRNADHAFRYGGDEFAVLLPQTTIDAAFQVAERVRNQIAKGLDSGKIPITASIGLASWPDDGISHTDIIAAADVTLYRAKRSGGNQSFCASGPLAPIAHDGSIPETKNNMDSKISSVVRALAETSDSRSYYTYNHSKRVADFSLALANVLKLDKDEMNRLEACAFLHDIGKIGIDNEILNKPGGLTEEEWQTIKNHCRLGADIARHIPQLSPYVDAILHHHEFYDGSGYPDGLKGDDIPLEARILAIADAFATLTSERSYAETLTHESALEEIKRCAGKQFDPYLVEQFITIYEKNISNTKRKARR